MVAWLCSVAVAGWLDEAPRVSLGPTGQATQVSVPLHLGDGDPRARVVVTVGEEDDVLALVDLTHGRARLGSILAARMGIDVRNRRVDGARIRVATLPWVRVGDVVLTDVHAEVVYGEELVLGVADLGLTVGILPSLGLVRFGGDAPVEGVAVGDGVEVSLELADQSLDEVLDLRTDLARSTLRADPSLGPPALRGGEPRWLVSGSLGGVPLPPAWWGDGPGRLGADAVAGLDLVFDAVAATLSVAGPVEPRFEDAAAARLAPILAEAEGWALPEPGDDLLARSRWSRLAEAAWAAGRPELASQADDALQRVASDRCELFLGIGERRLRSGAPDADLALEEAARLYQAWRTDREGRRQPVACARAGMLLAALRGQGPDTLDALGPEDGLAAGLAALRSGRSGDGPLRHAVAHGGRLDPAVRLALAVGHPTPAAVVQLSGLDDPAPLTAALALAEAAGPSVLEPGVLADPLWVAGRLVLLAAGMDDPSVLPLSEAVALEGLRRPGDPAVTCRAWLFAHLSGVEGTPAPDSVAADCFAARILSGDGAAARAELNSRWPELAVAVDDPASGGVRTMPPSTAEEPMIPAIAALALGAAHAGEFDHSHARLAEFLDGAVSTAGVDYGALASRRATLDAYLEDVKTADPSGWSEPEQLAFYVNAYNACTLRTILDAGPPKSIRDLDAGKVWDVRKFDVAGQSLTLNQMEHEHARKLADGRVHAVVNCASKGCPPLPPKPLTPTNQGAQLDAAARAWAATNAFTLDGDTIHLSQIFDWYGDDFSAEGKGDLAGVDGKPENALWFLSRYVDDGTKEKLLSGSLTADWQDYDWSLNKR